MKLSVKNLIIILAVLVIGFIVLQYTKRDNKSKVLKSELVTLDTASVTRVEVISPKGEVVLNKEGKVWMVTVEDAKKRTKKGVVKSVLSNLNSIKPGRLAAKSESKWKDCQVDSTGTRVKVYEGNEVSTDIILGRFGVEGQRSYYTFVRLFDDKNVYTAKDFMKMNIYEDANDYRDNVLMRLKKDSLTSIAFSTPEETFVLSKEDKWKVDGQPADSASVASYLSGLSMTSSKDFYNGQVVGAPTHQVEFTFSDKAPLTVEGYQSSEGIVLKSSENDFEYFLDTALIEKVFKQKSVFSAEVSQE
jgi:hypothetical protein